MKIEHDSENDCFFSYYLIKFALMIFKGYDVTLLFPHPIS